MYIMTQEIKKCVLFFIILRVVHVVDFIKISGINYTSTVEEEILFMYALMR
jgi:hypothetical protein